MNEDIHRIDGAGSGRGGGHHDIGAGTTPRSRRRVDARQAHMSLFAFNIGLLGGMAKGEIDYDADAASAGGGQSRGAPRGSTSRAIGPKGRARSTLDAEQTAALPDIWDEGSDIGAQGHGACRIDHHDGSGSGQRA